MEEIRSVLAEVFADRTVERIDTAEFGNRKRTALVTFCDSDSVVVQLAPAAALRTESALTRAIRERTSVPVPAVLGVGRRDEWGYLVAERANGVELHEQFVELPPDVREDLVGQFGRYLAELHETFRFEKYGPVDVEDDGLVATGSDEWAVWFRSYARSGVEALPEEFGDLREPIEAEIDDVDLPVEPPARLYPWDLRPGNALYDDGRISAVLDWGEPLSADAGLSVAKAEHLLAGWYTDEPLAVPFRDGYGSVRPLPSVRRIYRLVAVVRSAVDSTGAVTRPGYPERTGEAAIAFHRERLRRLLDDKYDR